MWPFGFALFGVHISEVWLYLPGTFYWQVPIHTVAVENDQLLRGWLSCPELTKKVTAFYESKTFQEKEAESASLRKTLANVLGIEKIELKDFYNV